MICLKIRTFVVSATTYEANTFPYDKLWFAWKFVPLWYQQQLCVEWHTKRLSCDLLENSYLCGISNNVQDQQLRIAYVVICLKIRTFVVSATTWIVGRFDTPVLWFAWKFVPLWYQQQLGTNEKSLTHCCDLLENSYLCGISNNSLKRINSFCRVVICLKIRTFVVSATTLMHLFQG